MGVWYCTREDVKSALDFAETARNNTQIDRAIEAASRNVEGLLLRKFYPQTATRYFDWPDRNGSRAWRLWLNADELISATEVIAGGVTIVAADYFLRPDTGPPFTHIEIDLASAAAFSAGDTHQRAISIAGVYGHSANEESIGTLSAALAADTGAAASVTFIRNVGVGDILKIDSERMIVTARTMVDSTQNLGADLTASTSDVTVAVSNGTAFLIDEPILIGSERMLIVDIAGNNLTVRRAWDGSVLAAHTNGADVYSLTGIAVERAQLGTTLAAHNNGAAITRHLVPGPVRALCIAEAINQLQQETSGYAATTGEGETARETPGAGLSGLRETTRRQYGRRTRTRAV